jgi:hypothetical protein
MPNAATGGGPSLSCKSISNNGGVFAVLIFRNEMNKRILVLQKMLQRKKFYDTDTSGQCYF